MKILRQALAIAVTSFLILVSPGINCYQALAAGISEVPAEVGFGQVEAPGILETSPNTENGTQTTFLSEDGAEKFLNTGTAGALINNAEHSVPAQAVTNEAPLATAASVEIPAAVSGRTQRNKPAADSTQSGDHPTLGQGLRHVETFVGKIGSRITAKLDFADLSQLFENDTRQDSMPEPLETAGSRLSQPLANALSGPSAPDPGAAINDMAALQDLAKMAKDATQESGSIYNTLAVIDPNGSIHQISIEGLADGYNIVLDKFTQKPFIATSIWIENETSGKILRGTVETGSIAGKIFSPEEALAPANQEIAYLKAHKNQLKIPPVISAWRASEGRPLPIRNWIKTIKNAFKINLHNLLINTLGFGPGSIAAAALSAIIEGFIANFTDKIKDSKSGYRNLFENKNKEPIIRGPIARLLNWKSDLTRKAMGAGKRWIMYKSLARKLVDDGRFFMLPLYSGMQTPIIDAVDYLADIEDTQSVPRLKRLFYKFTPSSSTSSRSPQTYKLGEIIITEHWGPNDYMPPEIAAAAAEALLKLLPEKDAKQFAAQSLTEIRAGRLGSSTLKELLKFIKAQQMRELAPALLEQAQELKAQFNRRYEDFKRDSTRGLSFYTLYNYENLAYAAYLLAPDAQGKEKALQMLIEEFNHPDASPNFLRSRPHDNINTIMSQIVDHGLAGNPAQQRLVKSQLNAERFAKDLKYYRELLKIHNRSIPVETL